MPFFWHGPKDGSNHKGFWAKDKKGLLCVKKLFGFQRATTVTFFVSNFKVALALPLLARELPQKKVGRQCIHSFGKKIITITIRL